MSSSKRRVESTRSPQLQPNANTEKNPLSPPQGPDSSPPISPKTGTNKFDITRLSEQIADLVTRDPKKAAILLTDWISRDARAQFGKSSKKNLKKTG